MKRPQLKRMTIVIAVCALVGALVGIAGSAAAPSNSKSKAKATHAQMKAKRALKRAFRIGPDGPRFGGPVHATAVIPNADGTGFETITEDSGTLLSVDGTTVHLKQGTDKATYKDDAAIDVGSNPKVFRNGQDAQLSDLKAGDHVHVMKGGPKGTIVVAEDDAFMAQQRQQFKRAFGHHFFGPGKPPPGGPGGYPGDKPEPPNENGSTTTGPAGGTNS